MASEIDQQGETTLSNSHLIETLNVPGDSGCRGDVMTGAVYVCSDNDDCVIDGHVKL